MTRSYLRDVAGLVSAIIFAMHLAAAHAADVVRATTSTSAAAPTSPAGMLQVMVGLILVLGVLVVIAWGVKKAGVGKQAHGGAIKIVGGIHVGNRERIMVIEVADEWIVVGVTPTSITALSTMPRQEGVASSPASPLAKNFSTWLQQTVDKRKAAAATLPTSTLPNSSHDA